MREERERTRAEQEQRAAQEQAAEQADAEFRACLGDLTPDERLNALREFGADYGRHTEPTHNLRQHVLTLNAGEPGPENDTSAPSATDEANAD